MRSFLLIIFVILFSSGLMAQGYKLEVKVDNYSNDTLLLGYHLGNKQYIADTAFVENNSFTFSGEIALKPGMYLVITKPDNKFFQLLLSDTINQKFDVYLDLAQENPSIISKISVENQLFSDYAKLLGDKRKEVETLNKSKEGVTDEAKLEEIDNQLVAINKEVKDFQNGILTQYPESLLAGIVRSNIEINVPEFTEAPETDRARMRFEYYKKHFFDNIDLTDSRMLYSPISFSKVNYYVEKMTVQHPDSIAVAIDDVLAIVEPNQEVFRYFLSHYLTFYGNSKYVGMDAVYVHLADNYYAKGKTPWTDEESLEKIVKSAGELRPTLVGKISPNLILNDRNGGKIELHKIQADYTVLIFWAPDCGHCKKTMPKLNEFYDVYSKTGVELIAVCTKTTSKVPDCWSFIDEHKIDNWINAVDPYLKSNFSVLYNIKTTPRVFILDKDKKIVSKGIGPEQIAEVIDSLREFEEKNK